MSIYGYCRISTAKQSIDRQIRNIKAEYPTAHIVQEAYTGTSIFRPEWLKLYRILRAGDVVVFDSVSRMSRNAEEGFTLYEDLYHKGIRLVFLKEHHIDTETYKKALSGSIAMTGTNVDFILKGINEYLMALAKEQIKLAFEQSEKEVADLHQRTREGLLTARLNGKQVGRKKGVGFETKKAREAKQIIRTHCKTPCKDGERYALRLRQRADNRNHRSCKRNIINKCTCDSRYPDNNGDHYLQVATADLANKSGQDGKDSSLLQTTNNYEKSYEEQQCLVINLFQEGPKQSFPEVNQGHC